MNKNIIMVVLSVLLIVIILICDVVTLSRKQDLIAFKQEAIEKGYGEMKTSCGEEVFVWKDVDRNKK